MKKIKNYALYFIKFAIYLVKLAFSKIRDFIRMRFPKLYIRLITINRKFLALGVIAVIVGIVGGIQIYPKVATYLSTPRPPKITQAPGDSGFQFQAADRRNSVITLIGESEGNVPKIQASFEKGAKVDFVLSEINSNIPKPKQEENKLTFNGVRDGVDVQYETVVDGLKESLILNKPVDGNKFVFNINAEGAKPESIGTNLYSNYFTDSEGNFLFAFVKPFAVDANGARTDHLVLTISKNEIENTYQASVDVNEEWLNSPDRAYPINIDPTITYNAVYLGTYGQHNRTAYTYAFDPYPNTNRLHNQELASDQYTVGLWHMNEATGTTAVTDSSGNNNTGTSSSSTNIATGNLGNARSFNGSSDYISTGSLAGFSTGNQKFTVEGWIKPTATPSTRQWPLLLGGATTGNFEWLWNTNGTLTADNYGIGACAVTPKTGVWSHFASAYDGNYIYCYLDGELVSTFATTSINFTATTLKVGQAQVSEAYFNGSINELRISNVARSAEEIRMSAQKRPYGIFTSDLLSALTTAWNSLSFTPFGEPTGDGETAPTNLLIAQWNFNSASGTTATNDADASSCGGTPSNCNFTLNNFASTGSQDATTNSGWTAANKRWGAGALMLSSAATADNLSLADPPNDLLDVGSMELTIEVWIKTTSSNVEIFSNNNNNGTACTNNGYRLGIDANGYPTYHSDRNGATAGCWTTFTHFKKVNDGKWHHIVASNGYNSEISTSMHALFVDGVPHTAETVSYPSFSSPYTTAGNIYIGGASGGFDGIIDVVRFYSRGLTKSEILGNYNIGNIELQTRVGNTTNPDDGTWEEWRPTTSEAQIQSLDADQANWAWDLVATYMPKSQANDSNIKVEGSGSLKLTTGIPQVDANTVALWHLDETGGSGAYIKDSTANANNLTLSGTAVANGTSGKSRSFNGTSNYLYTGAQIYSTTGGTFEAWINKQGAGTAGNIITGSYGGSGNQRGPTLYSNSSTLKWEFGSLAGQDTGATITQGKWHHVAMTWNSSFNVFVYLDGVRVDDGQSVDPVDFSNTFYLGSYQGSQFFQGLIDEVRVSNIARSPEEIAEAYRMGSDHRLTRTIASTDLSSTQKLAFNVAADRPGTYLEALIGNNAYANYEPDANTVGLWHLDDAAVTSPKATGGTITYSGTDIIHTFTSSGTITPSKPTNAQILVVGGGGGGGCNGGGGGGAGGVVYYNSVSFAAQAYSITVGGGGPATCNSVPANGTGQNTVIGAITAYGGGGAASRDAGGAAASGGSGGGGGGGAAPQITAGSGTAGQGSAGGGGYNQGCDSAGGGGGGAGAVGAAGGWNTGGNGGVGVSNSISGVATYYGGGGGGGTTGYPGCNGNGTWIQGTGGTGGGGTGETSAGTANRGGGGGAERAGGSGIVIIRYSGANLRDASGNNNDGTPISTTLTQGVVGKARSFNGTSDYISVQSNASLNLNTGFTLQAWIKTTSSARQFAIAKFSDAANGRGYAFGTNAGNLYAELAKTDASFSNISTGGATVNDGNWHFIALTYTYVTDGTSIANFYIDGKLNSQATNVVGPIQSSVSNFTLGRRNYAGFLDYFTGQIDEASVSNVVRSATDIRTAYEVGKRSHEITIDFGAKLDSGNLITGSGDTSFTVDAAYYGLSNKGSSLYPGDKIIVRENYDGTTYITQGTVSSVTPSTGAVSVLSWDVNSFPSGGYTANADVFKWQREYFDVMGSLSTQRNAITKITLRETNGNEGRSIWIDNLGSVGPYLSDPAGSTITSSIGSQYFQYRAILSTNNYNLGTGITGASANFASNAPNQPVMISGNPVTTTTVKWNFTNTGGGVGGITGFKLFDQNNNEIPSANISDCYTTPAATYCTETGITPNTTVTRKIAAYNGYGLSPYSLYSTVTTLAAIPPEPTLSSATATSLVLTQSAGTNTALTEIAIYQKTGTECNISGGYFLKADGTSNGATPVWLTSSAWGNVPISGLDLDNNQYIFCASARNTAGISTAYAGNATGGGYFGDVSEYTMVGGMNFASAKRLTDTVNGSRKVVGLDYGPTGWWKLDDSPGQFSATGGSITTSGIYTVHTFTSSGTFTPNIAGTVEAFIVGGGGGAGACQSGGGGGGGVVSTSTTVPGSPLNVVVGGGGPQNTNGSDSTFNGLTAIGGGHGGSWNNNGANGASGGGAGGGLKTGGTGSQGGDGQPFYYNGGNSPDGAGGNSSGGGAGAGGHGQDGQNGVGGTGGYGVESSISGTSRRYAGGGGGGCYNGTNTAIGRDGGGTGRCGGDGSPGTANTGGGGGGGGLNYGGSPCFYGAAGGSGTIIIRYPTNTIDTPDASGKSLSGVSTGTSLVAGKYGNARSFNGTSEFITIADNDSLSFTDNKITAEAWIKRNGNPAATEYIITKGTNGWEYAMAINTNGTVYSILWQSGGAAVAAVSGQSIITDGNWHHVAIVSTGSRLSIYVDGVEDDFSTGFTGAMSNTNAPLYIGDRSDQADAEFEGQIDDVRIYHAALSEHQIQVNMNSNNPQNVAKFRVKSGTLTLLSDETMSIGEIYLEGGSIAVPTGTTIRIGSPVWYTHVDSDGDGYVAGSTTFAHVGTSPSSTAKRKFLGIPPSSDSNDDCNDSNAAVHSNIEATGGVITRPTGYVVHTFTTNGNFTPAYSLSADFLLVGGGGSGGGWGGGGGGGGGYTAGTTNLSATTYQVVVGNGGVGINSNSPGANGGNSTFNGITAIGGGGGGGYSYAGSNGASGGGGGASGGLGGGTGSQGQNGGPSAAWTTAGGGGGYGGVGGTGNGTTAGSGGTGVTGSITGTRYSGGGGGGRYNGAGAAGVDGGGNGASESYGFPGTANTGGGGGGGKLLYGGGTGYAGGNGGSGIVVIRYPTCH
jgi:hypothetical protein